MTYYFSLPKYNTVSNDHSYPIVQASLQPEGINHNFVKIITPIISRTQPTPLSLSLPPLAMIKTKLMPSTFHWVGIAIGFPEM